MIGIFDMTIPEDAERYTMLTNDDWIEPENEDEEYLR